LIIGIQSRIGEELDETNLDEMDIVNTNAISKEPRPQGGALKPKF
jgi:hypothetical protein